MPPEGTGTLSKAALGPIYLDTPGNPLHWGNEAKSEAPAPLLLDPKCKGDSSTPYPHPTMPGDLVQVIDGFIFLSHPTPSPGGEETGSVSSIFLILHVRVSY